VQLWPVPTNSQIRGRCSFEGDGLGEGESERTVLDVRLLMAGVRREERVRFERLGVGSVAPGVRAMM